MGKNRSGRDGSWAGGGLGWGLISSLARWLCSEAGAEETKFLSLIPNLLSIIAALAR